jgi:hypothetical protein
MTTDTPKRGPGRPKKVPTVRALNYSEQVKANKLIHSYYAAAGIEDGLEARRILDLLTELLESAMS